MNYDSDLDKIPVDSAARGSGAFGSVGTNKYNINDAKICCWRMAFIDDASLTSCDVKILKFVSSSVNYIELLICLYFRYVFLCLMTVREKDRNMWHF